MCICVYVYMCMCVFCKYLIQWVNVCYVCDSALLPCPPYNLRKTHTHKIESRRVERAYPWTFTLTHDRRRTPGGHAGRREPTHASKSSTGTAACLAVQRVLHIKPRAERPSCLPQEKCAQSSTKDREDKPHNHVKPQVPTDDATETKRGKQRVQWN